MAKISAHGNFKLFSYDPVDNPFRVTFGQGESEKKRSFFENPYGFGRRNKGIRVHVSRKKSKEIHNTKEARIKSEIVEYDSDEVSEEDDEEMEFGEYERDELSYFRGLVLDISYSVRDVRLNWSPISKNGAILKAGDVVSVSGKGRLKIGDIIRTRKGKISVELIQLL